MSHTSREHFKEEGFDLWVYTHEESDLILQCAQELLSLFILDVASKVRRVGGKTTFQKSTGHEEDPEQVNAPREWTNSTFQDLAQEVVDSGLAHDLTDAYTLVIPAFNHYGLLPTEPNADETSLFSGEPDEAGPSNSAPLTRPGSNDEPSGEAVGES